MKVNKRILTLGACFLGCVVLFIIGIVTVPLELVLDKSRIETYCKCKVDTIEGGLLNGSVALKDTKKKIAHIGWRIDIDSLKKADTWIWVNQDNGEVGVFRAQVDWNFNRGLVVSVPNQQIDVSGWVGQMMYDTFGVWINASAFVQIEPQKWKYENGSFSKIDGAGESALLRIRQAYIQEPKEESFIGSWELKIFNTKNSQWSLGLESKDVSVGELRWGCTLKHEEYWQCPWVGSWEMKNPQIQSWMSYKNIPVSANQMQGWLQWK